MGRQNGTAAIIGLDALVGLGGNISAEIVILLATVSFACATIFGLRLSDYDPMVVAAGSLLNLGLNWNANGTLGSQSIARSGGFSATQSYTYL